MATNLHTLANNSFVILQAYQQRRESGLLTSAKSGQTTAFAELCQPYTRMILRTAYRITRNWEDAEDALQDSLLKAFAHIKDFDGRSRFSTWLTRITINSALMILRKKRNSLETHSDGSGDAGATGWCEDATDRAPNPEHRCLQQERGKILRGAIQALRPTIRQAFEIRQLQEHSMKETARIMGISVTAVKSRLFHARAALRHSFDCSKRSALLYRN